MAADCLENLADLQQQGVNEEVITNIAGIVYIGKPTFSHIPLNLDLTSTCSDGRHRSYL